jgi:hypothetical protein
MLEFAMKLDDQVAAIRAGRLTGHGNGLEQERRAAWLRDKAQQELRGLPL